MLSTYENKGLSTEDIRQKREKEYARLIALAERDEDFKRAAELKAERRRELRGRSPRAPELVSDPNAIRVFDARGRKGDPELLHEPGMPEIPVYQGVPIAPARSAANRWK